MGRKKVAILGGGPAALAVAWEITQAPGWDSRYELDVYTMGWRLGGKCASGRNPDARWRNEEHGLHVLGGFYHNTFQQLRPLYRAWNTPGFPHAIPFGEAFQPHRGFTIAQPGRAGWGSVRVNMPPIAGEPGVDPEPLTVWTLLRRMYAWTAAGLDRTTKGLSLLDWTQEPSSKALTPMLASGLATQVAPEARQLQAEFEQLAHGAASAGIGIQKSAAGIQAFTEQASASTQRLRDFAERLPVMEGAEWRQVLKFLAATSWGILADGLLTRGFDHINGMEAAQWLRERGGADDEAVDCPLFQASYHYAFAYVDGDPRRKDIAAGAGTRGLLRMLFTYHGTVFQHMNGGMGEIICVPYYEVLKKRGVRFHFFHRVESLVPAGDALGAIEFLVQAEAKAGSSGYDPLVDAPLAGGRMRRCWPTRPREDQLKAPDTVRGIDLESWWGSSGIGERKRLTAGVDFDECVLAIPAGVLPFVAPALAKDQRAWRNMLDAIATTPTVSAQIWRRDKVSGYGGMSLDGMFTGYELPHSTWADLSFHRAAETDHALPATMSILCGPVPAPGPDVPTDDSFPAREQQRAQQVTDDWVRDHARTALPGWFQGGAYDTATEYDRYVRMNSDPASLYVLTPAGSVDQRLRCDASGYRNLRLAGDWTRHNLDMGAVEAAVMSGRVCARSLCGFPKEIYGERDD